MPNQYIQYKATIYVIYTMPKQATASRSYDAAISNKPHDGHSQDICRATSTVNKQWTAYINSKLQQCCVTFHCKFPPIKPTYNVKELTDWLLTSSQSPHSLFILIAEVHYTQIYGLCTSSNYNKNNNFSRTAALSNSRIIVQ
jgi:hypothetical protein